MSLVALLQTPQYQQEMQRQQQASVSPNFENINPNVSGIGGLISYMQQRNLLRSAPPSTNLEVPYDALSGYQGGSGSGILAALNYLYGQRAAPRVVEMPAVTPVQPVMYNISDFLSPSLPPR